MAMEEVAEEEMPEVEQEAMVVHTAPVSRFRLLQANQRYNLALLEEHRLAEAQLEGERAFDAVVATIIEAEPGKMDVNQVVPASVQSARMVPRERY